jgi:hypothetical protein
LQKPLGAPDYQSKKIGLRNRSNASALTPAQTVLPKQTPSQIAESVKNTSDKISQDLKERSEKGVARSAGKRLIDAVWEDDEGDEN